MVVTNPLNLLKGLIIIMEPHSMLDPQVIARLTEAAHEHFHDPDGNGYTVSVGYGREVVSTFDGTVVYNHYCTPLGNAHDVHVLGQINDTPATIVNNYIDLVKRQHLESANQDDWNFDYELTHSDLIALD